MKNDTVKLRQNEEVVILGIQEEKIKLKINEEHIVLKVSGQGPSGTPGATPVSCTKVRTEGRVNTYRLLMSNGDEFFFEVMNGEKGDKGDPGRDGADGGGSAAVLEDEELLVFTPEVENYEGGYRVIPQTVDQTLDTSMKFLNSDVTVEEIPYAEVSNLSGGHTATSGG